MITYFNDKNNKPRKKYKKYKTTTTTILKSFDTFGIIATTSSSFILSFTGIGLIAIPISTATACGLSNVNKVIYEIIINKNNKHKKQFEKDQQTIKSFDKLYSKSLRDDIIVKNDYASQCIIFTKNVDERKVNLFYMYECKSKDKFF